MKKSNIIKVVLLILGVLLFLFLTKDYLTTKSDYLNIKKALEEKNQIVKKISGNNLQLNDRVVSKEAAEIVYKSQLDSLGKILKIKPKNIIQTIQVNSQLDAEIKAKTDTFYNTISKQIDSLGFNFNDRWMRII